MTSRGIIGVILGIVAASGSIAQTMPHPDDPIPYAEALDLDAERLAELGMIEVYDEIEPVITSLGGKPDSFREIADPDTGAYAIEHRGTIHAVSGGNIDPYQGQGNAAALFFEIVNRSMAGTKHRLYALGHGNDMQGVFLTKPQFDLAVRLYKDTKNAPFVPTRNPPSFGMPHEAE